MLKYSKGTLKSEISGFTYNGAVHSINHNRSSTIPIDLQEDILEIIYKTFINIKAWFQSLLSQNQANTESVLCKQRAIKAETQL